MFFSKKNRNRGTRRKIKMASLILVTSLILSNGIWLQNAQAANVVYVDSSAGKDTNSGASPGEAVKSLKKAKELAGSSGEIVNLSKDKKVSSKYAKAEATPEATKAPEVTKAPAEAKPVMETPAPAETQAAAEDPAPVETQAAAETPAQEETQAAAETPALEEIQAAVETKAIPETPTPEATTEPKVTAVPEPIQGAEVSPAAAETEEAVSKDTKKDKDNKNADSTAQAAPSNEQADKAVEDKEEEAAQTDAKQTKDSSDEQTATDNQEQDGAAGNPAAVTKTLKMLLVTVANPTEVQEVADAAAAYKALSDEEKTEVPQDLVNRLKKAQLASEMLTASSNAVSTEAVTLSSSSIPGNVIVGDLDKIYTEEDSKPDSSSDQTSSSNSSSNSSSSNSSSSSSSNAGDSETSVKANSPSQSSNRTSTVKTGDTTGIITMVCMAVGALIVIVILIVIIKKKSNK